MIDGVQPSKVGMQPVGEVAEVVDGVYQLKLPVPFPLRFVSVYLIKGGDGWTLVDTGYDYPANYEVWEAGAAEVGCDVALDVARIVVTHFHPDHLGGARWLQERSRAPVFMLEEEISFSRELWTTPDASVFQEHLERNGMPREMAREGAVAMRSSLPLPDEMCPLLPGEKLALGDGAARVIHTPGHADHQFVLHDEARGILFAADQVLLGITPNIGLWPESEPHPLCRYLESLDELRGLDVALVLPGHGPVFHDLRGRIEEITIHHYGRLEAIHAVIEAGLMTPYEVSRVVFRGALTVHQRCFALAETLAHLDQLALDGRAKRIENTRVVYLAM